MQLTLQRTVATTVCPSSKVCRVAAMFGLGVGEGRDRTLIAPTPLDLEPGQLTFITGPSGSGKSTILHLVRDAVAGDPLVHLMDCHDLPALPDRPLVDCFDAIPLEEVLATLSRAGLNDAFVMLRTPSQLSDGQRYRLRLAQSFLLAPPPQANVLTVMLADEFGATLDRTTAKVIARNVRKWVTRSQVCFLCATTHDDLLESLDPDVVIEKHLGAGLEIAHAART